MKLFKSIVSLVMAALIASSVLVISFAADESASKEDESSYYRIDEESAREYIVEGKTVKFSVRELTADPDRDGEITVADARLVLRFALELEPLSIPFAEADLDADKELTSADARAFLRYSIGLDRNFMTKDGSVPKGWYTDKEGRKSYFTSEGVLFVGLLNTESGIFYLDENGYAATGVIEKGDVFYCTANGDRFTGWRDYNGNTYYFKDNIAVKGWQEIEGKKYHFGSDGAMTKSWATIDGATYFFGSNGEMRTGLRRISGVVYYFFDDGKMATGLQTLSGFIYYFGTDGKARQGWQDIDGARYFFDTNFTAVTDGFAIIDDKYYYFDDKGRVKTGWQEIDGNKYYFYKDGSLATSTTIDGIDIDENGFIIQKLQGADAYAQQFASRTRYLILVNRSEHKLYLYEGSQNNWKQKFVWLCGDGRDNAQTVEGEFTINYQFPYFIAKKTQGRCWYCSSFYGNYIIHSVLYSGAESPVEVWDGRLGQGVSDGCVRLALENAKWIYDNCPVGTKVVVYHED